MFNQIKRVIWDFIVLMIMILMIYFRVYEYLPPVFGDMMVKAIYVSMGFLHAHITRKLAFPKVDWDESKITPVKILIISLYVIIIFAYARGG
ncbi:MAG: hypothetical protein QXD03_02350 [Candidatus Anstonellales archaeon]